MGTSSFQDRNRDNQADGCATSNGDRSNQHSIPQITKLRLQKQLLSSQQI